MTAWTNLTDAALSVAKPFTYVIARAMRDNVKAVAEGASGAPTVQSEDALSAPASAAGFVLTATNTNHPNNAGRKTVQWTSNLLSGIGQTLYTNDGSSNTASADLGGAGIWLITVGFKVDTTASPVQGSRTFVVDGSSMTIRHTDLITATAYPSAVVTTTVPSDSAGSPYASVGEYRVGNVFKFKADGFYNFTGNWLYLDAIRIR